MKGWKILGANISKKKKPWIAMLISGKIELK